MLTQSRRAHLKFKKSFVDFAKQLNRMDGKFSESYQDRISSYLSNQLNLIPLCVEIGFNSDTSWDGSNTGALVKLHNWSNVLIDAKFENSSMGLHKFLLTEANVIDVLVSLNIPKDFGYLSIDIDSTDYFVLRSILKYFRPQIISIEYNANFPFHSFAAMREKKSEHMDKAYGTSLGAVNFLAKQNNYSILWVVDPFDVFLIDNRLIQNKSFFRFPLWRFRTKTCIDVHAPAKSAEQFHLVDVRSTLKDNGKSFASKDSKYLLRNPLTSAIGRYLALERIMRHKFILLKTRVKHMKTLKSKRFS